MSYQHNARDARILLEKYPVIAKLLKDYRNGLTATVACLTKKQLQVVERLDCVDTIIKLSTNCYQISYRRTPKP